MMFLNWRWWLIGKILSADIKKEFDSEPGYNKKFLKTKIKSYGDETTNFLDKEIPKAGSNCTCLAVFMVDSALKKTKTIIHKRFSWLGILLENQKILLMNPMKNELG